MEYVKRLLIVDDSEIDRAVLNSILDQEFEIEEAENGYTALDILLKDKREFDAILLDVSMPNLDGISVLRILRENDLEDLPVFMITAEATKNNVEKAKNYNIAEFIKKPFDREEILKRIRTKLGVEPRMSCGENDIEETRKYIANLKSIYGRYLEWQGKDIGYAIRRERFMMFMLKKSQIMSGGTSEDHFLMEMIAASAYLCNIGEMFCPNNVADMKKKKADSEEEMHTVLGADLVKLNSSSSCSRFVNICSDICLHHHERYDGMGYPKGISGKDISIYTQMCGLLEKFDDIFYHYSRHNELQFEYVIDQLRRDRGLVSEEVFLLLLECKTDIITYYKEHYI